MSFRDTLHPHSQMRRLYAARACAPLYAWGPGLRSGSWLALRSGSWLAGRVARWGGRLGRLAGWGGRVWQAGWGMAWWGWMLLSFS